MSDALQRFLAAQSPALTRSALGARARDFFETDLPVRDGAAWRALAAELGIPCPPSLERLGDAMEEQLIYFRFRSHQYAMLTPISARAARENLLELAASFSNLLPFCAMLPLFGEDGDLLLLDAEGRIWALPHDDRPPVEPAVSSLDGLLAEASAPAVSL